MGAPASIGAIVRTRGGRSLHQERGGCAGIVRSACGERAPRTRIKGVPPAGKKSGGGCASLPALTLYAAQRIPERGCYGLCCVQGRICVLRMGSQFGFDRVTPNLGVVHIGDLMQREVARGGHIGSVVLLQSLGLGAGDGGDARLVSVERGKSRCRGL